MVAIRYAGGGVVALAALTSGITLASPRWPRRSAGTCWSANSRSRKGGNLFTYRAVLTNGGGALASATATATSLSSKVKMVDGTLTFETVETGGTVVSSDTFSLSRNPKGKFDCGHRLDRDRGPNHPPVANAGATSLRRRRDRAARRQRLERRRREPADLPVDARLCAGWQHRGAVGFDGGEADVCGGSARDLRRQPRRQRRRRRQRARHRLDQHGELRARSQRRAGSDPR